LSTIKFQLVVNNTVVRLKI